MKKIFNALLLAFIFTINLYAQNSEIEVLANTSVKIFTWDIEKTDKGTLMFLDVPFTRENNSNLEYLTLSVSKTYNTNRPEFISVIIPNNIDTANGIFLSFANSFEKKNGEIKMKLASDSPVRIRIGECISDFCISRMIGGYAVEENSTKKIDIFEKFRKYDHVFFLFIYPDGSNKSVTVPLFSFKQQYNAL